MVLTDGARRVLQKLDVLRQGTNRTIQEGPFLSCVGNATFSTTKEGRFDVGSP